MLAKADMDAFPLDLDPVEQMVSESHLESFPIDWLVDELVSSPVLTKAVLSRFVDTNRDGILSAQELVGGGGGSGQSRPTFNAALESNNNF